MGRATEIDNRAVGNVSGAGRVFGIPLGELGWFASLLIGLTTGMIVFFGSTFLGIAGILIYNSTTHSTVDFADSYKFVGLPLGATAMVLALGFLGTLWVKRVFRKE
jgi:hypothetical protein